MQTKPIIYNFNLNQSIPLDNRTKSVEDLNSLPPLPVRYNGLIIHINSLNEPYIFLNDLNTPVPLRSLSSGNVLSINTNNYRDLNNILNQVSTKPGTLLTVYPLGVTLIRNANEWNYFSGKYNLLTTIEYENLPNNIKGINSRVIINNKEYVIKSDYLLSELIISETSTPTNIEKERFYLINNVLYYSIGNKLWKLGGSGIVISNFNIVKGDNLINHNLNSTFVDVKIWINITNKLTPIHSVNFVTEDNNKISLNSYMDISGVTIIINSI